MASGPTFEAIFRLLGLFWSIFTILGHLGGELGLQVRPEPRVKWCAQPKLVGPELKMASRNPQIFNRRAILDQFWKKRATTNA